MPAYFITIDVGNSRIKCGLFEATDVRGEGLPTCRESMTVAVDADLPWPTIREWIDPHASVKGIVAGANPRGVQRVLDTWPAKQLPRPLVIDIPTGVPIDVKVAAPEKVGVDRLLNAVAANRLRCDSRPAIIVSTGTATTVDYVDASGAFAGGAILPGFELSARALHEYTALLPLITIEELAAQPQPLGKDTRQALCSGLFWGQVGAVRELIGQFAALDNAAKQVILTGGGAALLAPQFPEALREPHLALQGLAIVAAGRLNASETDRV
ncbi:MAG: type III pantothenate kinase [Planctomycetaceae bacterium]